MYPKQKRTQNKELLKTYHTQRCLLCGKENPDPDHIITRGAGGPDEDWNLWPLCRFHHTEKGNMGIMSFIKRHPGLRFHLEQRGWEIQETGLYHPKFKR